jgi:hypothetical protein
MTTHSIRSLTAAAALATVCFGVRALPAASQAQPQAKAPAPAQPTFATPELAVEAAVKAVSSGPAALLELLGPDAKDLIASGDAVEDEKDRAEFLRRTKEKTVIVKDAGNSHYATVQVGNDGFPLAIPLVETGGKWKWDTAEGRYEVLVRRVGANELDTITVCRGYVEAQLDYAALDPDNSGVHEYAQRIISTPGKRDGLYWKTEPGGPESPISEPVARAIAEGYTNKNEPYHGYYYRVLTAQGKSAPLGEMNFVVQGHMIGGFALVAWPAQYRVTGVKTFMISSSGTLYEKDLGPDTVKIASAITKYDPDKTWTVTNDGK